MYSPQELPINTPILAVYWADSDTRPEDGGTIWYGFRINSIDALLIQKQALRDIQRAYPSVSSIDFLLIATWDHLGYYSNHTDKVLLQQLCNIILLTACRR